MELRGSRSQPGPKTARSAQSPAFSSGAVFVRLRIGWWPKRMTSSSRPAAAFSSRLIQRNCGSSMLPFGAQAVALGDRVDRDQPQARPRAEGVVGGVAVGGRQLVAVDVAEAVRVALPAGRVQPLVGGPVGEPALGVGRDDDRACRARQQPGEVRTTPVTASGLTQPRARSSSACSAWMLPCTVPSWLPNAT